MRLPLLPCAGLLIACVLACAGRSDSGERQLVDGRGVAVRVPAHVAHVVTAAPNLSELVFWIGAGARIVGVSDQCDWPPEVTRLPRVGGLVTPDSERIARLKPDLVLASFEGNPPQLADSMRAAGIPLFVVRITSLATLREALARLNDIFFNGTNRSPVAHFEKNLAALQGRLSGKKVFIQIGTTAQAWSFGAATLAGDLLRHAGATNLGARHHGAFPQYDSESLARLDPDLVVLLSGTDPVRDRAFWTTHAPRARIVIVADPSPFERPGPRLIDAIAGRAGLDGP